jgi:hypothetical protein
VPALSVQTLLVKHRIKKIDRRARVRRRGGPTFLACGVKPTMIRFEHCHTARPALDALYRKLVDMVIALMSSKSTPSTTCRPRSSRSVGPFPFRVPSFLAPCFGARFYTR